MRRYLGLDNSKTALFYDSKSFFVSFYIVKTNLIEERKTSSIQKSHLIGNT